MTNFLGGSAARGRASRIVTAATALRIQNSVYGTPRPFGYGQARMAGNLGWYGNFVADFIKNATSGGKGGGGGGGGKSGASGGSYNYYTGFLLLLCEGPIDRIVQGWQNKASFPISSDTTLGPDLTVFDGDYQQLPWTWLQQNYPQNSQNFRGLAYVADDSLFLGSNTELPNFSFDIRFAIADALVETATVPASGPTTVTAQNFNWDYGVAGHFTVPYSSPYQIVPSLNPTVLSGLAESIDNSTLGEDWYLSNSSGVIWDLGATNGTPGTPLTRISPSLTPSTGQYTVTAAATAEFTFAAADAGQPVIIVAAALAPGVSYIETITGTVSAGSSVVTNVLPGTGAIVAPDRVLAGAGIPNGAFVTGVAAGAATGNLSSGSNAVADVFGTFTALVGGPVTDSAGAVPPGTTVGTVTPPSVTAGSSAALTASGVTFVCAWDTTGTVNGPTITGLGATAGISATPGSYVFIASLNIFVDVATSAGGTVTLADNVGYGGSSALTFYSSFAGAVTAGSPTISNPSQLASVTTASTFTDSIGAFPAGTTIGAVTFGALTLSANATANALGDTLSFAASFSLSQEATASGTVPITLRGPRLAQVLASPAAGEFTLSIQAGSFGQYGFAAADAGAKVAIVDLPDANPADVLYDFLTNPYYGMTLFPAARIGDLSTYRAYCLAAGLLVSPTITNSAAGNSFLADLFKATNSEPVWSMGFLTVVPYGDTALSANGATYTPPSAPLYLLDDDDFLANQGTNPHSVSAAGTPDPVTVTRLDPADLPNDITVEYLDRANLYNPTIVEAKDDSDIALFGLKNPGSKQLHLFCNQAAALMSAQLMLGRQLVRRTVSFTVGREYILLDPLDIVAITDANAGLVDQWVRIKEITENDDRSLSITAEEYLQGTGVAPLYGHQTPAPFVPSYNLPAPAALAPIMFDAPVQIGSVLGMETILATNGAGANWGGCEVWISSDNTTFAYAGTLWGGTVMGTLTASLAVGTDPDTADTLSVDLTPSQGVLMSGTQADADQGNTLCLVDAELVTYEQATLTAQWKYDLGKHGAASGYMRRGFYGTAIASHASGAPFARLKPGTYFTIGYGAADIGETVYVKLLSFNPWGGGKQTLADVASHSHTLAAPPAVSTGLLAGIIQTPDLTLNAASAQLTVSAAGPITLPTYPTSATLVSGILTTIGELVQIAYNAQFTNNASTPVTVTFSLTYQGVVYLDNASITILPGATATIAKQTTYTPGAQSGLFGMSAYMDAAVSPAATASFIDMSVTELRR